MMASTSFKQFFLETSFGNQGFNYQSCHNMRVNDTSIISPYCDTGFISDLKTFGIVPYDLKHKSKIKNLNFCGDYNDDP